MARVADFPNLERAVVWVAKYPFFPEKPEVVRECLEDVEGRFRRGELTAEQRSRLVSILAPN